MLKQTPNNNLPEIVEGLFSLTCTEEEGWLFLHIEIPTFSKEALNKLRLGLIEFKETALSQGHHVVFATTSNKRTVKFWGLIEPCYEVVQLDEDNWLGSWLTEEL